jgi:hypothetical protein
LGKGTKRALIFGAVPFLTLVFALPFVNRVEPFVLGLPFVLFWILLWVALTPVALFLAYKTEKRYNPSDSGDADPAAASPSGAPARASAAPPDDEAPR